MAARTTMALGGGAAGGALQGAGIGTMIEPGWGTLIGAIIGAAVGAGVGALALLLAKSQSKKVNSAQLTTTSIRNTPVPIVLGRARLGGNYLALGYFWRCKDNLNGTPGRTVRVMNAAIAISEGPILAAGNIHQDNLPYSNVTQQEHANPNKWAVFTIHNGTNSDGIDTYFGLPDYGFPQENPVPYRNTAYSMIHVIVGEQPRLPNFTFDLYGPDYTIRRSGSTGEPNPNEVGGYVFYDAFSEQYCYTLTQCLTNPAPWGMATMGRQGAARTHTPPPAFVTQSIKNLWYLGRHDLLVMQDPQLPIQFYIGYQGISPTSTDWEPVRPSGDLQFPMLCHYLDERHGVLHSLHNDGTHLFIHRWNLLTGKVDRTTTYLPFDTYLAFMYSVDLGTYITVRGTATIDFIDPDTGVLGTPFTATGVSGVVGVFVSGQHVGMVTASGCYYYNPFTTTQSGPFGSSSTNFNVGSFGQASYAHQNSWTGQVAVYKNPQGFVSFIPSCMEDYLDVNANGSSKVYALNKAQPDFQWDPGVPLIPGTGVGVSYNQPNYPPASGTSLWYTDNVQGWFRDWSWRVFYGWNLVSLQGFSSLAAAMWAVMVDEPSLDTKRFGAGLDPTYFCLQSFESVHAYCVGAVRYINPDGTYRIAERYKADVVIDSEVSVASLVADELLAACQGYRVVIDGKLHVGIQRPGMWPVWHFNDANTNTGTMQLKYLGRGQGVNRVRVDYVNILDEYRSDFAEAVDDFDIRVRNRIQQVTLQLKSVGRFGHADLLAKNILDQSMGQRRQAQFKTHWLGYVISPGDPVEISNRQTAMNRLRMWVTTLAESEDQNVELTALEHVQVLDAIAGMAQSDPVDQGSGVGVIDSGDDCRTLACAAGGAVWWNGGASYAPGTYTVTYVGGTYQPANDGSWQYDVAGFDIVTNVGGTVTVLNPAPAVSIGAPGWSSQTAAETANAGQTVTITLASAGPIGLKRNGGLSAYPKGSSWPTYNLCNATN